MNEKIIDYYNKFQIADLDDDMVGMCKAFVDWLKEIRNQAPDTIFVKEDPPVNFFKLEPHQPRMDLRINYRRFLSFTVKYLPEELDYITKLKNLHVGVVAGLYLYHMPVDKILELSESSDEFTRDNAKDVLLNDNMSSNWLKEPSGKDFSAIML